MESECISNTLDVISLAPAIASAVAAIFASIATWQLYKISKSSFELEKILIKNKSDLRYIDDVLMNLIKLKAFSTINPLAQSDDFEDQFNSLISNANEALGLLTESKYDSVNLKEVDSMDNFYHVLGDNKLYLDNKIEQLKRLRHNLIS